MGAKRKQSESGIYHVVARGTGRQLIFNDDADRVRFLKTLEKRLGDCNVEWYAWCLMNNHVHLLLRGPIEEISSCLKKTLGAYAIYFNAKSGRVGHLFQGRFRSEPVDTDEYLLGVTCYIHNNPVKAGISRVDGYPWSSYQEYLGSARYCDTHFVLSIAGGVERFKRLHENLAPADYLDVGGQKCRTVPMLDSVAIEIAQYLLGDVTLDDVKSLDPPARRQALLALKRAGLSVRQIERLTGVGRNTIQRAK